MQIDSIWLQENFRKFNAKYFGDELPEPRFRAGHSRTRLGSLSFKRKSTWGRVKYCDFTITLSNFYDQTEEQFQTVLLHEMIHLHISSRHLKDSSPHGEIFRQIMTELNSYGWSISVSTNTKGINKSAAGKAASTREFLVLAIETNDGSRFLSSVNPKFARSLNRRLSSAREITHHSWFVTTNNWFESMPRVRSLRGRRVTSEVYYSMVSTMKPIQF